MLKTYIRGCRRDICPNFAGVKWHFYNFIILFCGPIVCTSKVQCNSAFYLCAPSLYEWMLILVMFRYRWTHTLFQFRIINLQMWVTLACIINLLLMNIQRGLASLSASILLGMGFANTNTLASFTIPRVMPLQIRLELLRQLACLLSR